MKMDLHFFIKHFTYWIVVWFILYVIAKTTNCKTYALPNPFWWLVFAACVNLCFVLYTLYLILKGDIASTTYNLMTICLFIGVNICVKVLPILCLYFDVFSIHEDVYEYNSILRSILFGIVLFGVYSLICMYMIKEPYDKQWFNRKKKRGLLAEDGPLMKQFKRLCGIHLIGQKKIKL